eukprot:6344368-Lingulodinium_polyedra.AAC.1
MKTDERRCGEGGDELPRQKGTGAQSCLNALHRQIAYPRIHIANTMHILRNGMGKLKRGNN